MKISVIIPVYNEEAKIRQTIHAVSDAADSALYEIIVVDGGSTDGTISEASKTEAQVCMSPDKGRAAQMNYGASRAQGEVLYFLHADSIPPAGFDLQILEQIKQGCAAGCFRLAFDWDHPVLNFYAWCTRFDIDLFRFGDQSLFIDCSFFTEIGGFREDHILMEDSEIIRRIKGAGRFVIIPNEVTTSARKYRSNGVIRLQLVFTLIVILYKLGFSQQKLISVYKKLIY